MVIFRHNIPIKLINVQYTTDPWDPNNFLRKHYKSITVINLFYFKIVKYLSQGFDFYAHYIT